MSATILSPTVNADNSSTLSSAFAWGLDAVIQAHCVNTSTTVTSACAVTLLLSSDGGTSYVAAASLLFDLAAKDSFETFHVRDWADKKFNQALTWYDSSGNLTPGGGTRTFVPPWTHYRLRFAGNVNGAVTVSAVGDSGALSGGGGGGGSGTVTTVSIVSANGLAGTVANATTTPAITLTTSINGVLKGNGTAILLATAGTDYQVPISLTTAGSSGASTLIGGVLNIPTYAGGGAGTPGGSTADVQWNNAGSFAGAMNLTRDSNACPNFTALADPATPVAGAVYNSSTGGLTIIPKAAMQERLRGRFFSCGTCTAVSNTTAVTTIFGSPAGSDGSLTLKANSLAVGDIIDFQVFATWQSVASVTIVFTVVLGTTTVAGTPNLLTIATTQNVNGFANISGSFEIIALGSGTSALAVGNATMTLVGSVQTTPLTNPAWSGGGTPSGAGRSFDSTIDNALDIRITWGTAAAGDIFQTTGANVRRR